MYSIIPDYLIDFINNVDLIKHMKSSELNVISHRDILSLYLAFHGKFKFQYHEIMSLFPSINEQKRRDLAMKKLSTSNQIADLPYQNQHLDFYKYIHFVNVYDKFNYVNFHVCKVLADTLLIKPFRVENVFIPSETQKMPDLQCLEYHREYLENKHTKIFVDTLYDDVRIARGHKKITRIGAKDKFQELTDKQIYNLRTQQMLLREQSNKIFREEAKTYVEDGMKHLFVQYKNKGCKKKFFVNYEQMCCTKYQDDESVCMCRFIMFEDVKLNESFLDTKNCKWIYKKYEIDESISLKIDAQEK